MVADYRKNSEILGTNVSLPLSYFLQLALTKKRRIVETRYPHRSCAVRVRRCPAQVAQYGVTNRSPPYGQDEGRPRRH